MTERPILFSAPMVRAILDGNKTQTRRICKPAQFFSLSKVVEVPDPQERGQVYNGSHFGDEDGEVQFACPYGGRGDRLWVRESFSPYEHREGCWYWADGNIAAHDCTKPKPSIHMPRWASRITLEITGVRVERLQDISEADAWAEGCEGYDDDVTGGKSGYTEYCELWEKINGKGSWDLNPWVWVVEFKRVTPKLSAH